MNALEVVRAIFSLLVAFGTPAAIVGAITLLIVRASATNRGLTPPEASRQAMKGFWIAFLITLAIEVILIGLCIAAFTQAYNN